MTLASVLAPSASVSITVKVSLPSLPVATLGLNETAPVVALIDATPKAPASLAAGPEAVSSAKLSPPSGEISFAAATTVAPVAKALA